MPQKHDIGQQKKQANNRVKLPAVTPETLARSLVNRGLASPNVLDRSIKPQEDNQ